MTAQKHAELSLASLAQRFAAGEISAEALAQDALSRAADAAPLHAFVDLEASAVLAHAKDVDQRKKDGAFLGRIAGVPVALPDNLCTTWDRTRAGSRMLGDFKALVDAHAVEKLRAAGGVPFGKTNIDEMGVGYSSERSAFGPTLHPRSSAHTAGGSNAGAAAAVAAGVVPAALAVDTLGGLRQSAAHAGLVGLRPTYGAVSRRGIVALGSSFDALGVIATSVRDVAWVYSAIAGHDEWDSTSTPLPREDVIVELDNGVGALRVGVPVELLATDIPSDIRACFDASLRRLQALGATVVEVSLEQSNVFTNVAHALVSAEASSNFSRYDGVRFGYRAKGVDAIDALYGKSRAEGFGVEIIERILFGTLLLSEQCYESHYRHAQRVRRVITQSYARAFQRCDVLLTPTTVATAPRLGAAPLRGVAEAELDRFTAGAALASLPAVTLPAGSDASGMPVGVQLSAAPLNEATLLRVARALEGAIDAEVHA